MRSKQAFKRARRVSKKNMNKKALQLECQSLTNDNEGCDHWLVNMRPNLPMRKISGFMVCGKAKRCQKITQHQKSEKMDKEFAPFRIDVQNVIQKANGLLQSDQENDMLEGATEIRKILSIEKNPPIDECLQGGLLPLLVKCLTVKNPQIQFEAIWAITNVASGNSNHTLEVIKAGALALFIELLKSDSSDVREQTIWAFGNIAGDSAKTRDLVLNVGIVPTLCKMAFNETKISLHRNLAWTISNLCRGKPQPHFHLVKEFVAPLAYYITMNDSEVLTDSLWALSYLSDGDNSRIQCLIDAGCVNSICSIMKSSDVTRLTPALRTIGNVVTGDDHQTEMVLKSGFLTVLISLLTHSKKSIRKEAYWTLSNITAGNSTQIQYTIDTGILPKVIALFPQEKDVDTCKEAMWAVSNALSGGTFDQIKTLISCGLLQTLEVAMKGHAKVIKIALEGIKNMLEHDQDDTFSDACEQILQTLEDLQAHQDEEIYQLVLEILSAHFDVEEDGEVDQTAPNQVTQGYQF